MHTNSSSIRIFNHSNRRGNAFRGLVSLWAICINGILAAAAGAFWRRPFSVNFHKFTQRRHSTLISQRKNHSVCVLTGKSIQATIQSAQLFPIWACAAAFSTRLHGRLSPRRLTLFAWTRSFAFLSLPFGNWPQSWCYSIRELSQILKSVSRAPSCFGAALGIIASPH